MENYIYIRSNEYWDTYNAYKLGGTRSIITEECDHIMMEIKRGYYVKIVIVNTPLHIIMERLRKHFNKNGLNIYGTISSPFYDKDIENLLLPFLKKKEIAYKMLSIEDMNSIMECATKHHNKYDRCESVEKLSHFKS